MAIEPNTFINQPSKCRDRLPEGKSSRCADRAWRIRPCVESALSDSSPPSSSSDDEELLVWVTGGMAAASADFSPITACGKISHTTVETQASFEVSGKSSSENISS